jgi:flagellar biosynthetic protein FliR
MSSLLPINVDEITPIISKCIYSSVRISSFFATIPLFSQLTIPNYFKIILTMLIAFIFSPIISVYSGHAVPEIFSGNGLLSVMQEALIGIGMGVIFKISFEVLNLAGEMIGTSMQLNFAQVYSPTDNSETNILGSFYQIFGMLVFISLHGPIILFILVYKSFVAMPLCAGFINNHQIKLLLDFSQTMFVYSLLLSLPVMITLFIVNIGLMVISRLSTTFNIFTIGFPVAIFTGLCTLIFSLPPSLHSFTEILRKTFEFIMHWQVAK